jgi:insertion element IS1 protein InsB
VALRAVQDEPRLDLEGYDREKDRLIDWECGGRDEATFRRLFARLERWAACRRRFIVVSRSRAMIDRRMALFAHLHVNRHAKPQLRRLKIA